MTLTKEMLGEASSNATDKLEFLKNHDGEASICMDDEELKNHRMVVIRADYLETLTKAARAVHESWDDLEAMTKAGEVYMGDMRPETRNDLLRAWYKAHPILKRLIGFEPVKTNGEV